MEDMWNCSLSNTTKPVTTKVAFLPIGFAILVVSVFGIGANILSAIVLLRPRMKSTYSTITLGLGFCDTIFLLTKFLRYGLQSMFTYFQIAPSYTGVFYPFAGPSLRALTATSHTGFTYFTMAVAADRYLVVCWPLQARQRWTIQRSVYSSFVLALFAILYNLPRWWEFCTAPDNDGMYQMVSTPFRHNKNFRRPYKITYLFVMNFIPFLLLAFMNTKIWMKITVASKRKESMSSVQRKDKSFAFMLISVVVVFLICSSVNFVFDVVELVGMDSYPIWDNIGNFLLTLNSAINFVLYCAFGTRFRQECLNVLREFRSGLYRLLKLRTNTVDDNIDFSTANSRQ